MPGLAGGGLPDAEQIITADASGYLRALDEIIRKNDQGTGSIDKMMTKVRDLKRGLDEFERNLPDLKIDMMVDTHFNDAVNGIRDNIMKMAGDALKANADMEAAWNKHTNTVDRLEMSYQNARASINQMASDALEQNSNLAASYDNLHAKVVRLTEAHQDLAKVAGTGWAGGPEAGGTRALPPGTRGEEPGWTWTATVEPAMRDFRRAIEAGTSYVRAYGPGTWGGKGPEIWPAFPGGVYGGAGGYGGGIGGGGGGPWPIHPGGIFGGGDSGGGGGGFFRGLASGGSFDLGRAAADSARVGAFIKQWYGVAHWVMMLSNELLATVGPATVAAGMAGLVGMQGAEQVIPRGRAIFATAESLGPSLGITAGQAFGLQNAPLQTAQNLATGASFGLTGAVINSMRAGAGNAFIQLGSNTVAMFSRFAATMTQEFQQGLGKQLGNIVSGGTGYLQQLGDVVGNIGHVFLNVAPNLPGVGGDLLSTLQGATGGLAGLTHWLGPALGPILAGEAGARWGPALIGGAARGLSRISLGRLGTVARAATAADVGATLNPATGAIVAREGEMIAGTGLAGAMGGMGALQIGGLAAAAYTAAKAITWKDPAQLAAAATMQNIGQMGFAQGVPSILAAMKAAGAVPDTSAGAMTPNERYQQGSRRALSALFAHGNLGGFFSGTTEAISGGIVGNIQNLLGFSGSTPSNYQVAQQQLQQLSTTMVNALGSGQRVANVWKGLTGQTLDMGKAFDVATMAQLQLGNAFDKSGKLTSQAKTMIANLQTGYQAMNFTGGQFGGAVGAQTAMAGLQHTQLAAVNQAYDQLSQIVQGGAQGAASFFGILGGTPVTTTRGGIRFPAVSKGDRQFAQALGSFTTSGGAAAWNALTNQQTGLFPALENQMNWLRTAQTMGALAPGQTTSMAGFEIAQAMSKVGTNPAALAMLSTYAQQFGGPGFAPGASGKTMRQGLAHWIAQSGLTSGGFNRLMTLGTEGMANIGTDAKQFVQQIGSGIAGGLATGITTHGADLQNRFMDSILNAGGTNVSLGALRNYAGFMAHAGIPEKGALAMGQYVGQLSGASGSVLNSIQAMIKGQYVQLKVQADISQAKAAIANLTHVSSQPKVTIKAEVAAAQAAINAIKGKDIPVSVRAQGIAAVENAIAAIHGKTVTITINTINRIMTQVIGALGTPGGVAPATLVGGPAGMRLTTPGHASGYRVPGYGGGDRHLALLEGGEAVVPKELTPHIAGFLSMHHVPGFQTGGFVGQSTYGPGAYWGAGSQMALWNPALLTAILTALRASQGIGIFDHPQGFRGLLAGGGGAGGGLPSVAAQAAAAAAMAAMAAAAKGPAGQQFGIQVIQGLTGHIKNLKGEASSLAKALVNKLETEVKYATGVAQAAAYGQGFDPTGRGAGIFGSMNLASASGLTQAQLHASPTGNIKDYNAYVAAYAAGTVGGPGPQSVQDQMKSYLGTLKSFGGDITKLRKEHLNKEVMAQIIAAGPQQGDLIAQSILGGAGGVGAVNKIWQQIEKTSKGLGAQAAMAQYGGYLSPDLKHAQVSSGGVSINVNVGGGGTLDLTPTEIAKIVAAVQAALLKQAKKNNKTGVKLHGKGS